ncbi:hypothetical protein CR513_04756, partial [Mucuna pruriens]
MSTSGRRRYEQQVMIVQNDFQKLGKAKEELEACLGTFTGFMGEQVEIRGAIDLQTTFGAGPNVKIVLLRFMIVNTQASYNIILGRSALNQLWAIVSTPYLCMKYPVADQVGTIRADQQTAHQCYEASLKIGGRRADLMKVGIGLRSNVHLLKLDL